MTCLSCLSPLRINSAVFIVYCLHEILLTRKNFGPMNFVLKRLDCSLKLMLLLDLSDSQKVALKRTNAGLLKKK